MSTQDTTKNIGNKLGHDNLIPAKKGEVRNPNGRPRGARDVKTIIREAMMKIGQTQGMTGEEIEQLMHQSGIKQALKGNHQFYDSIGNRLYGKVKDKVEMDVTTREEPSERLKELAKKLKNAK